MFFFALVNLALVFVYSFLNRDTILTTICGVTLFFLFNYVRKTKTPGKMLLVIVLTDLVVLVLFYGYMSIWTNVHLDFLMLCLVLGAGFCALLALVHFVTAKEKVRSVLGWAAFCATGMNSLPLIAHLLK